MKKVYFAATLYATITGLSFLFTKIALESSNTFDLLAHRFSVAFLFVFISMFFKLVNVSYNKQKIIRTLPLAIMYPLLFFLFQTIGLEYITSSEAGILMAASPIFTLILAAYFLKEKTTLMQKLSIIMSVIGVIYVTLNKSTNLDFNSFKGTLLIVLSSLTLSIYRVMARKLIKDITSIELSYIMIIISFICYNAISIVKHSVNGNLIVFFQPLTNVSFVISIIYLGVLSSLGTVLLTNYILSKIEASKMSVFSNLSTIITIIAGAIYLKEDIHYYHIIGSFLIIGGVVGVNFLDKESSDSTEIYDALKKF